MAAAEQLAYSWGPRDGPVPATRAIPGVCLEGGSIRVWLY